MVMSRLDDTAYPPQTTVPTWPDGPPVLPHDARVVVLVDCAGDVSTAELLARWETDLGVPAISVRCSPDRSLEDNRASFAAAIAGACVGTRIVMAGNEHLAAHLAAMAHAAGFLDAEITIHVTDRARTFVRCAHCSHVTLAIGRPGDCLTCAGCGRTIEIYPHFSRHFGTYLGGDQAARARRRVATEE
jgi:dimethylamine monooxygenase subunit C